MRVRPRSRPGGGGDRLEIRLTRYVERVLGIICLSLAVILGAGAASEPSRLGELLPIALFAAPGAWLLWLSRTIVLKLDRDTGELTLRKFILPRIGGETLVRPLADVRRAEVETAVVLGGFGRMGVGPVAEATRVTIVFADGERVPLTRGFDSGLEKKHARIARSINRWLQRRGVSARAARGFRRRASRRRAW